MIHTIENARFRISARERGAELCAFTEKTENGTYEHLWEGNPDIWSGQSPLLFPIVGRLRDDRYILNGTEYHMPKHGFAKKMDFVPEKMTDDKMIFLLTDTEETRAGFPYAFALRVVYSFVENGFKMEFRVTNPGEETMYFSIGAHPAFRIALGDKVVMDCDETLGAYQFNEDLLRKKELLPVFENSRELVVTEHLFDNDALVFDGVRSRGASVIRADGHNVHVDFGGAPCLGIWAKPAAPYVCIEPWYGIDDICDAGADITKKERIVALGAGETFVFPVTVQIMTI
ncbi:MAG: aldose 1-epimerase family protein [Clostridia bacterium]|nr:aldose 1-epimerase family protein [Clostridia bacterium]